METNIHCVLQYCVNISVPYQATCVATVFYACIYEMLCLNFHFAKHLFSLLFALYYRAYRILVHWKMVILRTNKEMEGIILKSGSEKNVVRAELY
jgi:hypothetical protein